MKYKHIKTIIKKEILELKKDKGLMMSLTIVPMMFSIVLPTILFLLARGESFSRGISKLATEVGHLDFLHYPDSVMVETLPLYMIVAYLLLPLFMLIPIMISTVLASGSFIGEKEKRTLEALLYTPLSLKELMMGKILACAIPAMVWTILSMVSYMILVNSLGWSYFGHIILPNMTWFLALFVLSPLLVVLSILLVLGSSQYLKTSKSAQGIAMVLIVPILGMVISQAMGAMILGIVETLIVVAILLLVVILAFVVVTKLFCFERFLLK